MTKSKKYYAYFLSEKNQGICDDWKECEKIVSGKEARYKGFKSSEEAKAWLEAGAKYELKVKSQKPACQSPACRLAGRLGNGGSKVNLISGIYFDAGTGRGKGVEISVTSEKGENLLYKVMPKSKINFHGKHLISNSVTNNYGELLACQYALKLAIKKEVKKIFGDSKLVIEYWSRGFMKRKELPVATIKLADKVMKLRKEFEAVGGEVSRISGDDNPADLGFHR